MARDSAVIRRHCIYGLGPAMTQRVTGYRFEYRSAPPGLFTDVCAAVPRIEGPISACRFARPKTHLPARLADVLYRASQGPWPCLTGYRSTGEAALERLFTRILFRSFTRSYHHSALILPKHKNPVPSLSILCRQAYQKASYSTATESHAVIAASNTSDHLETATSESITPHAYPTPAIWTRYPRRCFLWQHIFRLRRLRTISATSRWLWASQHFRFTARAQCHKERGKILGMRILWDDIPAI